MRCNTSLYRSTSAGARVEGGRGGGGEGKKDRRATSDEKMSIQGRNLSDSPIFAEYFDALEADDDLSTVTGLPRFSTVTSGIANVTSPVIPQSSGQDSLLENLIIPLYGTIFFLSIVGNSLVLITLARNKRMRTVTNVYLLNLVSPCILDFRCTAEESELSSTNNGRHITRLAWGILQKVINNNNIYGQWEAIDLQSHLFCSSNTKSLLIDQFREF